MDFFPFFIWTYAVSLTRLTFNFEPKKKVVYVIKNVLKQRKYYESLNVRIYYFIL